MSDKGLFYVPVNGGHFLNSCHKRLWKVCLTFMSNLNFYGDEWSIFDLLWLYSDSKQTFTSYFIEVGQEIIWSAVTCIRHSCIRHAIMLSHLAIKLASFTPFCLIPNVLTIKSDHTIHSLVINDVKVPFSQGRNNRG